MAKPSDLDSALSSFMWDHHCAQHGGGQDVSKSDYRFSIINNCRDPMTHQHIEATRIQMELNGKHIDNKFAKRDYTQPSFPNPPPYL